MIAGSPPRQATLQDQPAVEAIVRAAYEIYLPRIGKLPGPMLDDYGARIAARTLSVLEQPPGEIVGIIVLLPQADHLLLDNVAVRPDRQRSGFGRRLIAFAEAEARRQRFAELRLYTHATMTENIALYRRLGFIETSRGREAGYDRVFMTKRLSQV